MSKGGGQPEFSAGHARDATRMIRRQYIALIGFMLLAAIVLGLGGCLQSQDRDAREFRLSDESHDYGRLGDRQVLAFAKLRSDIESKAKEFNISAWVAEQTYLNLMEVSGRSDVRIEDLDFTLALELITCLDFTEASVVVGVTLKGEDPFNLKILQNIDMKCSDRLHELLNVFKGL